MIIKRLIWLDEIVQNISKKHNVHKNEITELLAGDPLFRFVEKGHRLNENVYAAMGQIQSGRYLIAFFVYKRDKDALILSVRDMTPAERKIYERR